MDKPRFAIFKTKINKDNCEIYMNLSIEKNIKKLVKVLVKNEVKNVVLCKELVENHKLIIALNANDIRIFDGKWLEKYLVFEMLDFILKQKNLKREETELAVLTNEITDFDIYIIKTLAKTYKRLNVVTNHIEKLKKIEKMIYDETGVLIVLSNNHKKSLLKPQIILNLDFNKAVLNKYKINENAVIVNIDGDMAIYDKRFNGININDYEVSVGREECIWREDMRFFGNKELLEAALYRKDTFFNIRSDILKNKVAIKEVYGINGKIEKFS